MAGTLMAVQLPGSAGLAPTYNAVAAANAIPNNGNLVLHIKNGSGASVNATIVGVAQVDGQNVPNRVVAVPAGGERIISQINPGLFNFADGTIEVDFSAIATVTMAVYVYP